MTFGAPYFLLGLLAVPIAVGVALWLERLPGRHAVVFTNLDLLASLAPRRRALQYLPLALSVLTLAAATIALARPHRRVVATSGHSTIVLLVDVSGSMSATDVRPSRLGAAQQAMDEFAAVVPKSVQVALVSFSSMPYEVVPPTVDRETLRDGVGLLSPQGGTAIGDGLRLAVHVAEAAGKHPVGTRRPAAIVLLSDGKQTNGVLTPFEGAALAEAARIPVDTIALGTNGPLFGFGPFGGDPFGGPAFRPDPATLSEIASETGGFSYRAESAARVNQLYRSLGTSITTRTSTREISSWFSGLAAVLLLGTLGASRLRWEPLP
jgi:Ca-activated chloride channel homolog